jgi:predicted nucleotidyltransferase component of viral defense system
VVSFHEEAITAGCRQALGFLRGKAYLQQFYLAGGTGLALQIGHRLSTDLDWFSRTNNLKAPERERISKDLQTSGEFETVSEQDGLLFTQLFNTAISFLYQPHPLFEPPVDYQGLKVAAPTDIGLMKLAAINSRGTRRDFVDLFCLQDIVTLDRLLDLAAEKYRDRPSFLAVSARALAYYDDAEQQPMPQMYTSVSWKDVRAYCEEAARRLVRRLSDLDPTH